MTAPSLRVLVSDSADPWFNLAAENWIFRDMDPHQRVLFLWRNRESVVIGRFQNPWTECRVGEMERDGVRLVRRQSGGGAVYQDLNNTNFTFMAGKDLYRRDDNFELLINALSRLSIPAEKSGRNDILVDGKKVSGSAFKNTSHRSFHHGTMLINTDLEKLTRYLNPGRTGIETKGIASVRSRVANLTDFNPSVDHDTLCRTVIDEFFRFHGGECPVEHLRRKDIENMEKVREYYHELKGWDWRFGKTPRFSQTVRHVFDWGDIEVCLDCTDGVIERVRASSDDPPAELIAKAAAALEGVRYSPRDIIEALGGIIRETPETIG